MKSETFELRVVELINLERKKAGLKLLEIDYKLSRMAREKARDMTANRYFSHCSPTYGSPFKMMKAFGVKYRFAGENIASGYTGPEAVVKGWMASPGHRANILKPEYTHIGVGYCFTSCGNYNHYWTQEFIGKWLVSIDFCKTKVTKIEREKGKTQVEPKRSGYRKVAADKI